MVFFASAQYSGSDRVWLLTLGKTRVIVDDEKIHRMAIRDRLEAVGYDVFSAEGGEEALHFFEEEKEDFDLVVLDLLMPQPDGAEVFRRLKHLGISSRIPILFLTVMGLEPEIQSLVSQGAHYLQKYDAPKNLVAKVAELLSLDR